MLSISYIAFSSERVNITVVPLCSNKFWSFNAIFKLVLASVVPFELWAPSSGTPCPASITTVLPDIGKLTVGVTISSFPIYCKHKHKNT